MTAGKTHLPGPEPDGPALEVRIVDGKLPDEDLTTPERLLHMTEDELFSEAARYGRQLVTMDEHQLIGVAGLLMSAAMVVVAILLARNAIKAIRGETRPTWGSEYVG